MTDAKQTQKHIKTITRENVPESNILIAKILLLFSIVCFGFYCLFQAEILKAKSALVDTSLIAIPVIFTFVSAWCLAKKGRGAAFQYVFFALLTIFWLGLELMSGYKSKLLLAVLIVMSLRYYNKKFTVFVYAASSAALLASVWCNAYLYRQTDFLDLDTVSLPGANEVTIIGNPIDEIIALHPSPELLFKNGMIISFLPNFVFLTGITLIAIRFMKNNLSNMLKAEEVAEAEAKHQLELIDIKTKVMLSQIKPHFIYNTLSSVAMLCTKDPEKAKKLVMSFSSYLRNNLDSIDDASQKTCTFETELEHVKNYLAIELVRFEGRLQVEYDISQTDFLVPVLSIQPIVENAVKHGVCKREDGGTVRIASKKVSDGWQVIVSDNGIGFYTNAPKNDGKAHVGMANVQKRLGMIGGSFCVESTPNVGTTATIFIPEEEPLL